MIDINKMKTSHKKNRPFDFKLIDLVEPHTVLYQRQTGLSIYETMKKKNLLWEEIAAQMCVSVQFCIMRWSNLRGQYQKELRHCRELCPKEGVIRGSSWPYLERLGFLESTVQFNRPKRVRVGKRKVQQKETELKSVDVPVYNELDDDNDDDSMGSSTILVQTDDVVNFIDNENFFIIEVSESEDIIEESNPIDEIPFGEGHIDVGAIIGNVNSPQNLFESSIPIVENVVSSQTFAELSLDNLKRMNMLLETIDAENLQRIERRVMAFLCKCQLRALTNADVDDLIV